MTRIPTRYSISTRRLRSSGSIARTPQVSTNFLTRWHPILDCPHPKTSTGLALQELRDAELIEGSFASAAPREVARREVMMRMAGMALALPIVVSLLAPTPSMAASQSDPKIPAPIKYEPRFPSWWRWPWHW